MKMIIVALLFLVSSSVSAGKPSMSGHWQDANGHRFFLHHKANGEAYVWTVVAGRQVGFEKGKLVLMSPNDNIVGAMYEINAKSNETVHVGRACKIKNLSFSLLGVLHQWGWRGRNMEFGAVGNVSGTMVCGKDTRPWAVSYSGSWKRL